MSPQNDKPYKITLGSTWAFVGTWLGLALLGWTTGGTQVMVWGLGHFITGDVMALQQAHYGVRGIIPLAIGAVVVTIPLVLAIGGLVTLALGKTKNNVLQRRTMVLPKLYDATPLLIKSTVWEDIVDELFARGFLLGVLTIPLGWLIGPVWALYIMLFVSAVLQTRQFRHMYQKESGARQAARLLPQFAGLIIFAVVFVLAGLAASVLAHVLYTLALASLDRIATGKRVGRWRVIAASIVIAVGGWLLSESAPGQLAIPSSLHFWPYLGFVWFVSGISMLVVELLLYDPEPREVLLTRKVPNGSSLAEAMYKGHFTVQTTERTVDTFGLFAGEILNGVAATAVTCAFVLLGNTLQHFLHFGTDVWLAVVGLPAVTVYVMGSTSYSLNATARHVWENAPALLLVVYAFAALGFWQGVAIALIRELCVRLARRSLRYASI
ncbi:MAG TPA: hypothetical protein VLE73_06995 [Candidatus Saccharimonadales bacterium]|nr:hypothetical protein [Candidatus Saccharimonadales bacterium]